MGIKEHIYQVKHELFLAHQFPVVYANFPRKSRFPRDYIRYYDVIPFDRILSQKYCLNIYFKSRIYVIPFILRCVK